MGENNTYDLHIFVQMVKGRKFKGPVIIYGGMGGGGGWREKIRGGAFVEIND